MTEEHAQPATHPPTCRVVLDLRGISWATDRETALARLRSQPGVLDAEVNPDTGRAVVIHDSRTSLPQLWNWLVSWRTRDPD